MGLIDQKISNSKDIIGIIEVAIKNKLRGNLKVVASKAPGFGERKTQYLEDIAIMTGARLIKEELGINLDQIKLSFLGQAAKVEVSKRICTIVSNGFNHNLVQARIKQVSNEMKSI